ncbi:ATP-binding protein [Hyperthermus butylicus]|uniref:Universally conserved protein n=1 Tax=Hyperthermus butylicus (strain DSM 5456 / JCM 9403 / PLM1-5) TaxID=415426 RepID=A2BM14_HYPBU|nr:ATP-binding protein [Hyperthermus butylicus]ABM81025.1 universally conserved protein [Hyperthermus butylicus DSM 5456]
MSRQQPGEVVGFTIDNATPSIVRFVSTNPPPIGDYVVVESPEGYVLGLVERVGTKSMTLAFMSTAFDPRLIERLGDELRGDVYFECIARLLGRLEDLKLPRLPPLPGARVYKAPRAVLEKVFGGKEPYYIRLGVLASRPDVQVNVNVNMLVTRHTAILAITGAGKSNTVAVIVDRLVRIGGTVVILDFHGEYLASNLGGGRVNIIEPRLNPRHLSIAELMTLLGIEHRFYNQERVLRKALRRLEQRSVHTKGFLDELAEELEKLGTSRREEVTAINAVINKIESVKDRYSDILDDEAADIVARIRPGYANVVDLSRLDRDAIDVTASHLLRKVLWERKLHKLGVKSRLPYPILIVVEEAHILAPKDEDTLSKYWLARIAREGRKFGVGLMLVSQRPKTLDPDILSQANNLIVLRIVEPSDQRYIQAASESLTDDLVEQLPALNTGEAIVIGPLIRVPALVKIDKYPGPLGGSDIDVVAEWQNHMSQESEAEESTIEDVLSNLM